MRVGKTFENSFDLLQRSVQGLALTPSPLRLAAHPDHCGRSGWLVARRRLAHPPCRRLQGGFRPGRTAQARPLNREAPASAGRALTGASSHNVTARLRHAHGLLP